jgi:hypothetical protein
MVELGPQARVVGLGGRRLAVLAALTRPDQHDLTGGIVAERV